jgi:GNAT superfamily N-acetyltransferase
MEQRHPHDPSHWYLFILGTEQAAQGQGLGSALLAHMLARVDAAGCLPTWSPPASGTSPYTAATASQSPARSRSRAAQGSGPCGASPESERVLAECRFSSRRVSGLDGRAPKLRPLRR